MSNLQSGEANPPVMPTEDELRAFAAEFVRLHIDVGVAIARLRDHVKTLPVPAQDQLYPPVRAMLAGWTELSVWIDTNPGRSAR